MKKLLILVTLHILLLSLSRFTAWPENLLWPYLNSHGLNFYRDIFILYPPLYWLSLSSVYKIFGLSLLSLKFFSYLIIAFTDILLYFASGRKLKAVLFYIPLQIFFDGNGAWVDHLLAPIFLSSYLALQSKKYWLLGLFLSLALITKQTAAYLFLPVLIILFSAKTKLSEYSKIALAGTVPLLLLLLYLLFTQSLAGFFDSAVKYILTYHTRDPFQTQWPTINQALITVLVFLPVLLSKNRKLSLLAIFAALGIFTRFEYFHLQPALPFLALIYTSTPLAFLFYLVFLLIFSKFYFRNLSSQDRFFTPEFFQTAQQINAYVPAGSRTLFLNTWDHYYFLTGTLPAGNFFVPSAPWTYNYDGIQNRLTENNPKYIFYNHCFSTKGICYQPRQIAGFLERNYQEISKLPDGTGVFEYNPVASGQKIQADNCQH